MQTPSFVDPSVVAEQTARMLLEIEAVNFQTDPPFTLTSGKKSPSYIDCRKIISFPRVRSMMMDFAVSTLARQVGAEAFDAVAGGETAGIPFSAFIAERLELPMNYVRKKPKGFGRDAQIEGAPVAGKRVLLVEDLATDGGSKMLFANALRDAEATCAHTFVVFFYDIFPGARESLAEQGVQLHALTTWADVLAVAKSGNHLGKKFDRKTLDEVEAFLNDPVGWQEQWS